MDWGEEVGMRMVLLDFHPGIVHQLRYGWYGKESNGTL